MRDWPFWLAMTAVISTITLLLFWAGQDKQGQFSLDTMLMDPGLLLFMVGPYALLAFGHWLARGNAIHSRAMLAATLLLIGLGLAANGNDHRMYLTTPAGHENQPILGFLATLVVWLGSLVSLVIALVVWCVAWSQRTKNVRSPFGR